MKVVKTIGISLFILSYVWLIAYVYIINHNVITSHDISQGEHYMIWDNMCKKVSM